MQFDEKQTRLLEYQNRLRTTEFEPELDVTRGEAEDEILEFIVENEGIDVAFGLNLLVEGRPSDSFQPQRVNPVLDNPKSDFRGYLRSDDAAKVFLNCQTMWSRNTLKRMMKTSSLSHSKSKQQTQAGSDFIRLLSTDPVSTE